MADWVWGEGGEFFKNGSIYQPGWAFRCCCTFSPIDACTGEGFLCPLQPASQPTDSQAVQLTWNSFLPQLSPVWAAGQLQRRPSFELDGRWLTKCVIMPPSQKSCRAEYLKEATNPGAAEGCEGIWGGGTLPIINLFYSTLELHKHGLLTVEF